MTDGGAQDNRDRKRRDWIGIRSSGGPLGPWPFGVTVVATAAALALAFVLYPITGLENVDLVFLPVIIAIAIRYGFWPSLAACVLSALAYFFFFLPPVYGLNVTDPANVATLFFFFVVAVITSHLAARRPGCGARRGKPGRDHGGAVHLQPQDRRDRHARRPVVGHGTADRLDAAARRGDPAPRCRWQARGQGRLPTQRPHRRGRYRCCRAGLGREPVGGTGHRGLVHGTTPVPAPAHQPRPDRRESGSAGPEHR